MNREEEIREMQEELRQLYGQVQQQQQRIVELHNRLMQMGGQAIRPATNTISPSNWISENFIGLRLIHLIGIVVLVIGLSIGVKYAIDRNLVSETMRILLAYSAGIVLFILSFRLKKKYTAFSAILLSGAMASLYFTTYAAFVYYSMMLFGAAFAIMVGLTFFTTYQSVIYDRQEIALLGLVGAYGIPFLISQNSDRADLFFLYISLINLGVAFLAIKKAWKWVSRAAQAITWVLFIAWAATRAEGVMMGTGTIYLVWFFLLFATMSLSQKIFYNKALELNETYQLITNNLACYLAAVMLYSFSFEDAEVATVTFVFFVINMFQALALHFYWKEPYASRMMGALALVLFILFIATKWEGLTVTLLWLLTAVALFAWGMMKRSSPARMAAIILMGTTLLKLVAIDTLTFTTVQKVISYLVLGVLLLVVSFFYQKFRQKLFGDDK